MEKAFEFVLYAIGTYFLIEVAVMFAVFIVLGLIIFCFWVWKKQHKKGDKNTRKEFK